MMRIQDYWKTRKKTDAVPVEFKEANKNLTKPQGMTDDECGPLPVYNDGTQSISCWLLPFKQRLRVLFTGRAWLCVVAGHTQPPVWVSGKYPFQKVT